MTPEETVREALEDVLKAQRDDRKLVRHLQIERKFPPALAALDTLVARIAELTKERDEARHYANVLETEQQFPTLQAENTRLREALERIAELDEAWVVMDNVRGTHLVKLARAALHPHPQETE